MFSSKNPVYEREKEKRKRKGGRREEKIRRQARKYFKMDDNITKYYKNLLCEVKIVLRGRYIDLDT